VKKEHDLSKLAWKRTPYTKRREKSVTIRLDEDLIQYFKKLSKEVGIPYQRLTNMYLRECAESRRKAVIHWASTS